MIPSSGMENFFAEQSGSISKTITRMRVSPGELSPGEFVTSSLMYDERQIKNGS